MKRFALVVGIGWVAASCTKKVDQCSHNSDCTDPAFPFCDVNGQFAASGGMKNICTITPPDCPVDVCGCMPGTTTCTAAQLSTCNSDGMSTTMTTCSISCAGDGLSCATFTPSNNLGTALLGAASDPDLEIPSGAVINTDTGVISGVPGVSSTLVMEGSIAIRVFAAPAIRLDNVTVLGSNSIAFVASGTIDVEESLDASATAHSGSTSQTAGGAGADTGTDCRGMSAVLIPCNDLDNLCGPGAGGGGNGTIGGNGGEFGATGPSGGAASSGFEPLVGGCSGGATPLPDSFDQGYGGGAIQLVSSTLVQVNGLINVGGSGGDIGGGGGAGGFVAIEAPAVTISATGGILANGGGGGGGCGSPGADATPTLAVALGGTCDDLTLDGGSGGTGTTAPSAGGNGMVGDDSMQMYGGGGGAVGRARIATRDGTVQTDPGATMSVVLTTAMLVHD